MPSRPPPPPSQPPPRAPLTIAILSGSCAEHGFYDPVEHACEEYALRMGRQFEVVVSPAEHRGCNDWTEMVEFNAYVGDDAKSACGDSPWQRCICERYEEGR